MELPKYSNSSKIGEKGITIVKRIVENDLGWIFRKNNLENDFGIDAYIDLISEIGQVTGKSIAIQLKTGKNFFQEKNNIGWIYRGEMKHLNYYLNHDIPVIVIIIDPNTEKAYWSLCDGTKTQKAGDNWKITIPFMQELNAKSKEEFKKYTSPIIDFASQLDFLWNENKMLKEQKRIIFIVDRSDIEKGNYEQLIQGLKRLEVNPELVDNSRGKIDILIYGYDEDSRYMYEIEEVKKWVDLVFEGIIGWAYYLAMDEAAQFMRVMQLCYMKYKRVNKPNKKLVIDLATGKEFFYKMFTDLNIFCKIHNIPEEINKEVSFKLGEYLSGVKLPEHIKLAHGML